MMILACRDILLLERKSFLSMKESSMPIYEFYSPGTRKIYSFFARSLSQADETPLCPDGEKYEMRKLLCGFSITGQKADAPELPENQGDSDDPFAGMDPARAEGVMKELEGALDGMDDDNPDPRQMGKLMRKMCEMTGENMDEPMEEVVRKLEEGMDPDALEERMSDFLGDEEGASAENTDGGGKDEARAKLKNIIRKPLVRDPELYEFSEYLPS